MKRLTLSFLILSVALSSMAQSVDTLVVVHKSVFEKLAKPDSITGASVRVHQDERINLLFDSKNKLNSEHASTISGYRVQVFSSNAQKTAKNEAFRIEKELKEIFPEYPVYVNYTSPFWKVRVGDFKTLEDAKKARLEIIDNFPNLKSETYTVRDHINN